MVPRLPPSLPPSPSPPPRPLRLQRDLLKRNLSIMHSTITKIEEELGNQGKVAK